jgi:hypothetical protein
MKSDQDYLAQAGITDTEAAAPTTGADTTPTTGGSETAPETGAQTQPQTTQEMFELMGNKYPINTEFQVTHGGKIMKVPYNSLVQTYRQAANMTERYHELKKAQAEMGKYRQDFDRFKGFHDKYGQLQEWSEKNPQEWQRLWELYQNKDQHLMAAQMGQNPQGGGQNNNQALPQQLQPLLQKISQLESKFGEVSKVRETWESQVREWESQVREQEEMKSVDFVKNEVVSFSKQFPEIPLAEQDPEGTPLWAKIVQWGNANGYKEFTPAAFMFLKDRIADAYSSRGRAEALKSQKQDFQQGIVRRSATPITSQGKAQPANIRKMSWSEVAEMAKDGIGQMSGT